MCPSPRRCSASPPTSGSRSTCGCSAGSMDEETLTVWLDTALLMLGGFILMTVLLIAAGKPPAKSSDSAGEPSPGNVVIEAQWPDQIDADVDLWVEGPGARAVRYSHTGRRR